MIGPRALRLAGTVLAEHQAEVDFELIRVAEAVGGVGLKTGGLRVTQ